MVKGISRQVIVLHSPEEKMFEQAIFILKDGALGQDGVTEEALLQEAKKLLHVKKKSMRCRGPVWACGGALVTGLVWLITVLL